MGLICSKGKNDTLGPPSPRLSPFGRFSRRSFRESRRKCVAPAVGSLLSASLDALSSTLHLQDPKQLANIPTDLAQLLIERLIETGKLNDAAVLRLRGQTFYHICLDSYPEPIRDFWMRNLIKCSIELLDLSRTQVDNFMLTSIGYLPNLTVLRLDCCDEICDAGLSLLHRLPALKELSLAGCDGLGPLGLGCIGRASTIKTLNLEACHKIWGLGPLRQLTALESLDLGWCNSIGDEDAAALASLSTLKHLRLCHTEMTDAGVSKLSTLTGLTSLSLGGLQIRDFTAAKLVSNFSALKVLNLSRCGNIGDDAVKALAAAAGPVLEDLDIAYTDISDTALDSALPKLRNLRHLSLDSCSISDSGLHGLSSLKNLEDLDLSDTGITNGAMAVVAKLPRISKLNLSFTEVNDWGLERLSKASSLKRLNLDSRFVGDKGVSFIARLPNLEVLDLFGATVTDLGCAALSKATSLRSLEVCSGTVTDVGVTHLASLPHLQHLSLSQNWRVSNASIPALMRLTGVTALNLSQTRVTSTAVVTLGCLPALQVLALAGTKVKPSAVEKLQTMKPDLEVRGVAMN